MARPSETAQVDIGPDEIVKSNSCSNGSYMIDVSLSDLPQTPHNAMCANTKHQLNISQLHEYYGRARTRSDLLRHVHTYGFLKCCTEVWPLR